MRGIISLPIQGTLQSQFNFYSISSPCYFSPQQHQGFLEDSWNNPAFTASHNLGPACFSCLKLWCVATQTLCAGWARQPFVFKHNKFTVAQQCPLIFFTWKELSSISLPVWALPMIPGPGKVSRSLYSCS